MSTNFDPNQPDEIQSGKVKGERYERIAFTFCKAASLVLLITLLRGARYMLPIISGITCLLYLFTYFSGKKETRCILSHPLLVAAFWGVIGFLSLWVILR